MQKLRNVQCAHVDHGKTTLVDKMILAGNILRDNAKQTGELILDNNDLERERGITILSKNVSVIYKDYKINIAFDTPGRRFRRRGRARAEHVRRRTAGRRLRRASCPRPGSCCKGAGAGQKPIV